MNTHAPCGLLVCAEQYTSPWTHTLFCVFRHSWTQISPAYLGQAPRKKCRHVLAARPGLRLTWGWLDRRHPHSCMETRAGSRTAAYAASPCSTTAYRSTYSAVDGQRVQHSLPPRRSISSRGVRGAYITQSISAHVPPGLLASRQGRQGRQGRCKSQRALRKERRCSERNGCDYRVHTCAWIKCVRGGSCAL